MPHCLIQARALVLFLEIMARPLLLLTALVLAGCSKPEPNANPSLDSLIRSLGCVQVAVDSDYPLETLDRGFYESPSYKLASIHTEKPLDGYHGPTVGKYILALETYPTEDAARKRVDEYLDLSRLAKATPHDQNALSKMTVRCWSYRHGNEAYLLTTQAALFAALEALVVILQRLDLIPVLLQ
jgi:hypothetical protein